MNRVKLSVGLLAALALCLASVHASYWPPLNCPRKSVRTNCANVNNYVCGTDGITYQNPCFLRRAAIETAMNIQELYAGPCDPQLRMSLCPKRCRDNGKDICDQNGVTHANVCLYKLDNCGQQGSWVFHWQNKACFRSGRD